MTEINLLPWREQLRTERKTLFFVSVVTSAFSALIVMLCVHLIIQHRVTVQIERNALMAHEIKRLDAQIKEINTIKALKEELITRMYVIQDLQTNRSHMVHFFDELVKVLPKGIYLNRVVRVGNIVTVKGMAESNTNISNLMRQIDFSKWLFKPHLMQIKRVDKKRAVQNNFELNLSLKSDDDQDNKVDEKGKKQ